MLNKLINKQDLTQKEAEQLLIGIMDGQVTPVQAAAILIALRMKGESVSEIVGFVKMMREKMLKIKAPSNAIDVCGTGGDASNTFNISTAVAFVVAGVGVPVVKHGNRAASSKSGSADVLQALGVNIQLTPEQAEDVLNKVGIVFLRTPFFHPSMKQVAMVRGELKIRTVFNFLGPFANPGSVKRQLIGVPNKDIAKKLAEVGRRLGYKHLIIVTSEDGLDEISTNAKTHVFEVKGKKIKKYTIDPQKYYSSSDPELAEGESRSKETIRGGDAKENVFIIKNILEGKKGPKRDIVVLNSAVALYVAGRVKNIQEGIHIASESIDSKSAQRVLENLVKETRKYAK